MNSEQFLQSAASTGLNVELAGQIARNAPEKDEFLNLYILSQIFKCFSVPPFEIMPPEESGFVVVGSCTNGDQIVLNTSDDYGAVYYLNHESIYSEAYKLAKVALTLDEFMALANECENPIDYYEALDLDVR